MTPEQKAFYEYGGAWETTVVIHTFIRALLKDKGYQLSPELLHHFRDEKSHYGEVLREAWKWRRKCRAWVPAEERYCSNCRHINEIADVGTICEKCPHYNGSYYDENKWEPREEEE